MTGLLLTLACGGPPEEAAPVAVAPVAVAPVAPAAAPSAPWTGQRIVAVGDLHGDLDNAIATFRLLGVTDDAGHWAGGDTTLVQTGDTTDRGPDSRAILAWLRALQIEAPAAGGRVVPLLGNHEVMNLRGDLRYVDPGDTAAYGGPEARVAAFSSTGDDGRWLRTLGATAKVHDTVFAHGGIHPDHTVGGIDGLNARVRAAIDTAAEDPSIGETGPLWYRGYVQDPEEVACPLLARALADLGARRMVVGHTTRKDGRVEARCGGALLVIDIGIADPYGAHLGGVELRAGTDAWVGYPDGPLDLPDPP